MKIDINLEDYIQKEVNRQVELRLGFDLVSVKRAILCMEACEDLTDEVLAEGIVKFSVDSLCKEINEEEETLGRNKTSKEDFTFYGKRVFKPLDQYHM